MINDDAPKIYGLDDVELDGPVYVTEGLSTVRSLRTRLLCADSDGDVGKWGVSNPIWIYDNEPRNRKSSQELRELLAKEIL